MFPDELRGMKRPFKTAGRGLGLMKCNPFRNCKPFHMTRFQPHPDTEEPGLFRRVLALGRSQMSVSIAGAAGGEALPLVPSAHTRSQNAEQACV